MKIPAFHNPKVIKNDDNDETQTANISGESTRYHGFLMEVPTRWPMNQPGKSKQIKPESYQVIKYSMSL